MHVLDQVDGGIVPYDETEEAAIERKKRDQVWTQQARRKLGRASTGNIVDIKPSVGGEAEQQSGRRASVGF